jgi:hypothetical protein
MDFLLNGVSGLINKMAAVLGGFSFTHNLGQDLALVVPYMQKANALLPMDTVFIILGLYITIQLLLITYYWITRAINLLRGAG